MELADALPAIGKEAGKLQVRLSNQLVHLLSEQMYSSPLKAIEELVVNSYDADASQCRIGIPVVASEDPSIVVFDDGSGMDFQGLEQLWHIGASPKRGSETSGRGDRKLIGKFGIGKLATYAIANRITYVSRQKDRVFHVTCDFRSFKSNPEGASEAVPLQVNEVTDLKVFRSEPSFIRICEAVDLDPDALTNGRMPTWTLCVLESLKPKAADLKIGRLKWVLRTAMPLKWDFTVSVNGEKLESAKAGDGPLVKFTVADLPSNRVEALNSKFADKTWHWSIENGMLRSEQMPSGIQGDVIVTDRSLVLGKSADIERSHGFFVRVRGRLVNQKDELFGLHALTHATFNFFRADINADDLNSEVTAPREGLEVGDRTAAVQSVLLELFNEARSRQQAEEKKKADAEKRKREHERTYISTRLVERPIADTLSIFGSSDDQPDADDSWFYLRGQTPDQITAVVEQFYSKRRTFKFDYVSFGKTERLVKFDPSTATFSLNNDHEIVVAYSDDPRSQALLEDVATSEVLLEVYMRESGIDPFLIGEVLERRDLLMRSLAQERVYSLDSLAKSLRDSVNDEDNLEVALVAAARALGFNAKHISKAGEPDGLARFVDFKTGETKITLEAKSSEGVPSLSSLDFAGLAEHVRRYGAQGCLLVAPAYVGEAKKSKTDDSAVENRASADKISCWTVEDLARVVEAAETHQITASQVLEIVLTTYTPSAVQAAVETLLNRTNMQATYREIIKALRSLAEGERLPRSTRTVQHISAALAISSSVKNLSDDEVRAAIVDISNASKGMLRLSGEALVLNGDLDELERRVALLTGQAGPPRRNGTFWNGPEQT